jgi:hypothetical protein
MVPSWFAQKKLTHVRVSRMLLSLGQSSNSKSSSDAYRADSNCFAQRRVARTFPLHVLGVQILRNPCDERAFASNNFGANSLCACGVQHIRHTKSHCKVLLTTMWCSTLIGNLDLELHEYKL